ncbi:MAG TPA: thiolase family protein [Ilumatobacteraceae bacterium]
MSSIKDRVAVVGVGTTPYSRDSGRTSASLVVEACIAAIRDAGLDKGAIDGLCGSNRVEPAQYMQSALGLTACTWFANTVVPIQHQVIEAMNAVHSGSCTHALVYHGNYRASGVSRSAGGSPFRARYGAGFNVLASEPETFKSPVGYAPWAAWYLRRYNIGREVLGKVAINSRSNAVMNAHAAIRTPLTMADYLSARMVRDPLTMFDMDYPIDGADAFVFTSAERARDLHETPVLLHAAVMGLGSETFEDQVSDLDHTGQQVVVRQLAERSDIGRNDVDVLFPYDGFSIICARWFEALGFCGPGEANAFFDDHWDEATNRLLINGRVPVNSHGGSLSDGGVQGSNHFREAVLQLRGEAGPRQVSGAKSALLTPGGMFFNSGGIVLRRD